MTRLLIIIIGILILEAPHSYSKNYYFSSSGNDALNTGISETSPYKTIAKLNTLILNPGDKILFKRGESFNGQINVSNSGATSANISYDAYGTGDLPVINGGIVIGNWKHQSGNMYVADVPYLNLPVQQLLLDGSSMTLARYPNSGFLINNSTNSKVNLSSKSLTQPDSYWNGANLIVRTERWMYETKIVKSFAKESLLVESPTSYEIKSGIGFFLNNKFTELDTPGEWYHDVIGKKLYIILPPLTNPINFKVEVSNHSYGFNMNYKNHISISNLAIYNQKLDGIYLYGCNDIYITNNIFSYSNRNGIGAGYLKSSRIKVINNTFNHIGNNGIDLSTGNISTIQGNTLKNISMHPENCGLGIGIHASYNSYIGNNILDSIGYNGIHGHNGDTITYNYISNTCLTKDDGAGIYFYKSDHIVVKNNVITNSIGNGISTSIQNSTFAVGIYLDDSSSYCTINSNTVLNGDYGIFVHNSFNNTITSNILYNNRKAQMCLQNDRMVSETVNVKNNAIHENIFYSVHPDQLNLRFWTYKDNVKDFGTFNNNTYCNPYNNVIIKTISVPLYPSATLQKTQMYEFNDWKQVFKMDLNSKLIKPAFGPYYNVNSESANLILNGSFDSNLTGWYKWGTSNYSINLESVKSTMSGNSLKSSYSTNLNNAQGNFANGNFAIGEKKYYKLSLKAQSGKISNLHLDIMQNVYPYTVAAESDFVIKNTRTDIEYIVMSNASFPNGRLTFANTGYDSTQWVDDIKVTEVLVDTNKSTPLTNSKIFINNTSKPKTFSILGTYIDLFGNSLNSFIIIPPYSSKIYLKAEIPVNILPMARLSYNAEDSLVCNTITVSSVPAERGEMIHVCYPKCQSKIVNYSIIDLKGKEIISKSSDLDELNQIEISTAELGLGIYLFKTTIGSTEKVSKIIIQ
jgi:parallel beta-helix repeat protein